MNFINSIKICYTKKYAKFEGRASRSEFWYFLLFYYGVIALTILIDVNYLNKPLNEFSAEPEGLSDIGVYFLSGFVIISTLPHVGVAVRLWHDRNKQFPWSRAEAIILGGLPIVGCFFGLLYILAMVQ